LILSSEKRGYFPNMKVEKAWATYHCPRHKELYREKENSLSVRGDLSPAHIKLGRYFFIQP
jgi:hypothetical protein